MKKIIIILILITTTVNAQTTTWWGVNGITATSTDWFGTKNNLPLNFKTNNLFRATITNGGLFGIGTATPLNDLHIKKASTGEVGATVENTNQTATDYANFVNLNGDVKTTIGSYKFGGYGYTGTESNHDFFIYANNNTAFVMKPSGNIGIGTTPNTVNPTNRLYIGGTVGSGLTFEGLNSTSSVTAGAGTIGVTSTGEVVRVASAPAVTTVSNSFISPNLTTTVNGVASTPISLTSLFTANNGLTKTAQNFQLGGTLTQNTDIASAGFNTTISGNGNVGIGTATPTTKLHVVSTATSLITAEGSNTNAIIEINNTNASATNYTGVRMNKNGVEQWLIGTSGVNANGDFAIRRPALVPFTILQSNGNVGIGNTTPLSTFDVNGSFAGGNIRTITASITCQPTDRYIVCLNGAVGITVNLPTASTCPRRSYTISRGNGSTGTVSISGVSMQNYTGALVPNLSLGALGTAPQKGTWTSDGTTWWLTN